MIQFEFIFLLKHISFQGCRTKVSWLISIGSFLQVLIKLTRFVQVVELDRRTVQSHLDKMSSRADEEKKLCIKHQNQKTELCTFCSCCSLYVCDNNTLLSVLIYVALQCSRKPRNSRHWTRMKSLLFPVDKSFARREYRHKRNSVNTRNLGYGRNRVTLSIALYKM